MFTHLHVHSNFSFLDSGSSVRDLVDRAKELGYKALALTDHNGLYGVIRFYKYAKDSGIKPIIGAEITMEDGHHIVLLAKNLSGYSNLCKIITRAHLSHEKGQAAVSLDILRQYKDDLFCLSGCRNGVVATHLLAGRQEAALEAAMDYMGIFGKENFFIELQNHMLPGTNLLNQQLVEIAEQLGLKTVATNNVHYARKEDFKVQDIMVCVQTITTLDDQHEQRKKNCEYYLKSEKAMAGMFKRYPEAVKNAGWIADQCDLDLSLGTYRFPDFPVPEGETAYSYLCKLCFDGLERLYKPITPKATERLQYELKVIHDLGFAEYFLVVWDIVRHAKEQGIRCSGRGSAADSMVSYCLGITIADPLEHDLLFERFLNPARRKMPDIDIDFDAQRRDEVIAYIYERFGEDKVAMVCTVNTLCARSSLRDIGKAMDFPPPEIDRFAKILPRVKAKLIREAINEYPELRNSNIPVWKLETLIDVCERIDGFPRHLSVHLGGVVISRALLTDLVPLEWATKGVIVSQFDKDDVETLGLVKMDILGLRNLSAIEDALALIRENRGIELDIDNIPLNDSKTYKMLRSTRTVGLFQIESPGMRGLLGRLQPTKFEDIIATVAMFRPGPMQADMISPFIARRHGEEPVVYPHPCLEPVLKETYGVILYQEQVLKISNALAGFDLSQADSLRRAMTTDRSQAEMEKIKDEFIEGCLKRGVNKQTAEDVFSKLRAFAAYGFCKAHAASFGKIAYQTAYLKAHYPAEFMAGILSNEPMGFYPANVIAEEARHFGVRLLPVDVNRSGRRYTVEGWGDGEMGGWEDAATRRRGDAAKGEVISDQSSVISGEPNSLANEECGLRSAESTLTPRPPLPITGEGEKVSGCPTPSPLAGEGQGEGYPGTENHEPGTIPYPTPYTRHLSPGRSPAIRIALSQVKGMTEAAIDSIISARSNRPFDSFSDFCLRTKVDRPIIENLINCGAFDSFGHPRGKLMWLLGEVVGKVSGARCRVSGEDTGREVTSDQSPVISGDCVIPSGACGAEESALNRGKGKADPSLDAQDDTASTEPKELALACLPVSLATSFRVWCEQGHCISTNPVPYLCKSVKSVVPNSPSLIRENPRKSAVYNQSALFDGLSATDLDEHLKYLPDVPELTLHERMKMDFDILGLTPLGHPMIFYREKLSKIGVIKSSQAKKMRDGAYVKVAGVVVVLMRPPTRSGNLVVFVTLEDEDGLIDTVTFRNVYEKYGPVLYGNSALIMEGRIKRMGKRGVSLVVSKVAAMGPQYRTDDGPSGDRTFKERIRAAGQRSWVRSGGV